MASGLGRLTVALLTFKEKGENDDLVIFCEHEEFQTGIMTSVRLVERVVEPLSTELPIANKKFDRLNASVEQQTGTHVEHHQ